MGNPVEYIPLPSGSDFPSFYTQLQSITDASGRPLAVITPDSGTVTISGVTDAGPGTNSTIVAFLFGYGVDAGLPEQTTVVASSTAVVPVDLGVKDSQGNELYHWSVTMDTAGLAPGVYALQSFVDTKGFVTTNGVPVALYADEPDQATVTVQEYVPFTYTVHEDTKIVSVGATQTDTSVYLPGATSNVQISTDGRYAVWTNGDQYEEDLQTGATVDLTTTGGSAPALAIDHSPTVTQVGRPDPYGPQPNGGYDDIAYPTFIEGGVTFGSIPDFDFNPNDGSQNPLPTATDANGNTALLTPFGSSPAMVGYATAASDNGNAVLTVENTNVSYFTPFSSSGITASPQYYVTYRSPAPTLSIDPVNGTNQFAPGASSVTLTGTSDAIGQMVEIDFGQAGAQVGTATVQANGTWNYTFDASAITGSSLFIEASVMSALGTPAEVSETAAIDTETPPKVTDIFGSTDESSVGFGPGETLTIYVNLNAFVVVSGTPTLTLSNGEVATYSSGPESHIQLEFTYVPRITDPSSTDLSVTGLDLNGGSITDANGNMPVGPFTKSLGLYLQTVPAIVSLYPNVGSDDFTTTSNMPTIAVRAELGETVTVFDNGNAIGTGVTNFGGGATLLSEADVTPTVALPDGQSILTAVAVDGSGQISAVSSPATITVATGGPDAFAQNQAATTGSFSGSYLWSNPANWSNDLPTVGSAVGMAAVGVDDIAGLSLSSLSVSPPPGNEGKLSVATDLIVDNLTVAASSEIDVLGGADLFVTGAAIIDGTIVTDPSTLGVGGAVTGTGTIDIGAGSNVIFEDSVAATETVDFVSNTGTLTLADPSDFAAQIVGTGVVICYLRGTLVATPTGEVPIETLVRGDCLPTRFGGVRTIEWIGRQSFAAPFLARNRDQWPIRIAAGALGPARPARDLYVSPGHAMLIGDRLILARNLVNGVTIAQNPPTEDVRYYQVEFETHDCILAEGTWSESYADAECLRNQFHNVADFRALFPDRTSPAEPALCAPRPQSGPALAAALMPIVARATAGLAPGPLRGWIESIEPDGIVGWAQDTAYPDMPVLLDIWLDDQRLGSVLACDYRGDLAAAGIGRGHCSFRFETSAIPLGTARHLSVRRATDAAALPTTDDLRARLAVWHARCAAPEQPGPLRGWIDAFGPDRIVGWAQDQGHPDSPVQLELWLHDTLLGTTVAASYRRDLEEAGIGRGYCGFTFDTRASIPARHLVVRRAADGAMLQMTPELRAKAA